MHQMEECPKFKSQEFRAGAFLILQGLFKKVVLGDNLSPIIAQGFSNTAGLGLIDAWITVIGFSYQLYFDFSGYTDIGRGSALLLGYKVPENFNLPFLAASLTDFWRRWHMSLSTWLRDYLFISLGGSRGSALTTKRNLILTMVLGGLWHGAAWHFVIWGAVHGFGLTLFKDWSQFISQSPNLGRLQKLKVWHLAGVVLTNLFVYLAFAVFRAANLDQAGTVISKFFGLGVPALAGVVTSQLLESPLTVAIPAYFAYFLSRVLIEKLTRGGTDQISSPFSGAALRPLSETAVRPFSDTILRPCLATVLAFWDRTLSIRIVTYLTVLIAIVGFAPSQFSPFIYFQF
jgi:D-alanyl-lipoteichoic acid acyltransferase DltB (MBOAT superfamily)